MTRVIDLWNLTHIGLGVALLKLRKTSIAVILFSFVPFSTDQLSTVLSFDASSRNLVHCGTGQCATDMFCRVGKVAMASISIFHEGFADLGLYKSYS
jgi:hypothetical protein